MNKLKTFLATIAALLCSFAVGAYDFEKDGIYYTITATSSFSNYVKVTYRGNSAEEYSNEYSGDVIIPSEVTYNNKTYCVNNIGYGAFLDCSGITSITIPKSVTTIGQYAFSGCTGELVVNCDIPSASYSETYGAFYNSKFTKVTIGADVTSFGSYAFKKCFALKELIIEDGSNTLSLGKLPSNDEGLFYDCPLEFVYLGRNFERRDISLYQPFYQKYTLKKVVIGDNVKWINNYAFYDCRITSVTIPEGVETIGKYAFYNCSLSSITIPKSVTSIGDYAFWNGRMKEITCLGATPPTISPYTFSVSSLYVPYSSLSAYKNDSYWKKCQIYPIACKLTIVVDGENYSTQTVYYGESLKGLYSSLKEGYTFVPENNLYEMMPANAITISGCFHPNKYKVIFKVDGQVYNADSVVYGTEIILPAEPTKEGHTFGGWSELSETMPAHDVVTNAIFTKNKYKVTFKIGDEVVVADSLEYGADIIVPEAPEKVGYTFNGWGEVADVVPAGNLVYEGSYSVNSYLLSYVVDGDTIQTDSVVYGTEIILPAEPTKEGHTFGGWSELSETMLPKTFPINIAGNADDMLYSNAPCKETRYGDQFVGWHVLFDGDANTFFHSDYSGDDSVDGLDHYLRVDMGEGNSIKNFSFTYTARGDETPYYTPTKIVVEGSNEADGEYTEIAVLTDLPTDMGEVYESDILGNSNAYRYIRYRVTETRYNSKYCGHPYFYFAEFGMSEIKAALKATMPAYDMVVNAVYVANIYQVYYFVGADLVHVADVAYGERIPEYIYEPEEGEEVFLGWLGDEYETMPAHEVYLTAEMVPVGIEKLIGNGEQKAVIYDLQGRRVLNTQNLKGGIYIVNGKKFVIK